MGTHRWVANHGRGRAGNGTQWKSLDISKSHLLSRRGSHYKLEMSEIVFFNRA